MHQLAMGCLPWNSLAGGSPWEGVSRLLLSKQALQDLLSRECSCSHAAPTDSQGGGGKVRCITDIQMENEMCFVMFCNSIASLNAMLKRGVCFIVTGLGVAAQINGIYIFKICIVFQHFSMKKVLTIPLYLVLV